MTSETEGSCVGTDSDKGSCSPYQFDVIKCHSEYYHSSLHNVECNKNITGFFLVGHRTDVVLIAGERRIPAHTLILSGSSQYFAAIFPTNFKESKQHEIEIHDVDGDDLWNLVNYCYTGKLSLHTDSVKTLIVAARLFLLTEAVDACCTFIKKHLDSSNCLDMLNFFGSFNGSFGDVLDSARNYVLKHFLEVIGTNEFLLLSADELAKFLESDDVNVSSEQDIFQALVVWIEHDPQNRAADASRLFRLIRLPFLSASFIADQIEANPLFSKNSECWSLIMDAYKLHSLPDRRTAFLKSYNVCPRNGSKDLNGEIKTELDEFFGL